MAISAKQIPLMKRIRRDKWQLMMMIPSVVLLVLFSYMPIYGILIAFQDYQIGNRILSFDGTIKWVGLLHFKNFIQSEFFSRVFFNTIRLSLKGLIFGFWVPIVFALTLNEIHHKFYKRLTQTLVYLPYFISLVVVIAMLTTMVSSEGVITRLIVFFGGREINYMRDSASFDTLYIASGVWQSFGYSSIIYLAGIAGIDPTLYEAAVVDGANRFHRMWHITLPGLKPTIAILLILSVGGVLHSNTEKVLLMISPSIVDRAQVIGTYVYELGLRNARYSYTSAIGLFTNIINFFLVFGANMISRRVADYSLW
ncbi:MAG: ABC transporter permease subunit [Bacillota bacterium]|nr:ABC transporter permease subunit [Bacillota bacterium]